MAKSGCAKWGIGCGVVAVVLIVLIAIGGVVFYRNVVKPVGDLVSGIGESTRALTTEQDRLKELDERFPAGLEGLDALVIEPADVDAYLALRRVVAMEAAAAGSAFDAVFDTVNPEVFGGDVGLGKIMGFVGDAFESYQEAVLRRTQLCRRAHDELESRQMSPEQLERMIVLIDWRFLQRAEMMRFGVPRDDRSVCTEAQRTERLFEPWLRELADKIENREEMERELEKARWVLDSCREKAEANTAISEASRSVLEARRNELQALPSIEANALATMAESLDPDAFLPGDTNIEFGPHRKVEWK